MSITINGSGTITGATTLASTIASPTMTGPVVSSMASSVITSGTSVASTSGTSIDFTGIPSWVKRITVMFNGTSLNATGAIIVQIGSGSFTTTGYSGAYGYYQNGGASLLSTLTTGFGAYINQAAGDVQVGTLTIFNVSGNNWVSSMSGANTGAAVAYGGSGNIALGGALDRVRITTVAGTSTFDAGSINILYE